MVDHFLMLLYFYKHIFYLIILWFGYLIRLKHCLGKDIYIMLVYE